MSDEKLLSRPDDGNKRPLSRWRWWTGGGFWKRLFLGLLVCIAIRACIEWYRHHEAVTALNEAIAEQDRLDPGWQLDDLEAARRRLSDAENGGIPSMKAHRLLPKKEDVEEVEKLDSLDDYPPQHRLRDGQLTALREYLERRKPALGPALELENYSTGRFPIEYTEDGLSTLLPHIEGQRKVAALLMYETWAALEEKDNERAAKVLVALANSGRVIGDEPIAISQLVRIACVEIALTAVERMLAQSEPTPATLARLRRLLTEEEAFPRMEIVVRGERALMHRVLSAVESGAHSLAALAEQKESWDERLFGFWSRDFVRRHHLVLFPLMRDYLKMVGLPTHERGSLRDDLDTRLRSLQGKNVAALLFPALNKIEDASIRVRAKMRCTIAGLAAERYRIREGKWPAQLGDLVPEFLEDVPTDPYTGAPIHYRPTDDGVVIYSVGLDKVDDLGAIRGGDGQPADRGVRLWNLDARRQPALAE